MDGHAPGLMCCPEEASKDGEGSSAGEALRAETLLRVREMMVETAQEAS